MTASRLPRVALAAALLLVLSGCALGVEMPSGPPPSVQEDEAPEAEVEETPAPPPPTPSNLPDAIAVDAAPFVVAGTPHVGPEFVSPSGNLQCAIRGTADGGWKAGCAAAEHTWEYPPCTDEVCSAVTVIQADGEVGVYRRGGAEFATEAGLGAQVLAYGYSVSYDGVTCVSTEDGMICEDQVTRHGFLISRSEHTWF